MECRGLRETEMAEMIALQCVIFRPDGHQRYTQYIRGDSSYTWEQTRIGLEDGRMISTLRIWDRQIRIGARCVRMGGIGGVGTHPDFRGAGRASALVRDANNYLQSAGYHIGMLFTEVPCRFYRRQGWASLPMTGFHIEIYHIDPPATNDWQITLFDETRDLEEAVTLYDTYNAQQSASIVRPRAHWDTMPARFRDLLPTVVARRGNTLGGYLNYQISDANAYILEIAYDRNDPTILAALVDHLLQDCTAKDVKHLYGELPHRHPLVESLVTATDGDLHLNGKDNAMIYAANLPGLMQELLPELQQRLDDWGRDFTPIALRLALNEQECVLKLSSGNKLEIATNGTDAVALQISAAHFWRLLFGETGWSQLAPTLEALGLKLPDDVSALLSVLFPTQEPIFWAPDHF
jgi:predicted acetyltransferase